MNTKLCSRCRQQVESQPCPYCGSANVIVAEDVTDGFTLGTHHGGMVITAPSNARIECKGITRDLSFDANITSTAIINACLSHVSATLPSQTRQLLIHNVNVTEIASQQNPMSETATHSFTLDLSVFKFSFKRMAKTPL